MPPLYPPNAFPNHVTYENMQLYNCVHDSDVGVGRLSGHYLFPEKLPAVKDNSDILWRELYCWKPEVGRVLFSMLLPGSVFIIWHNILVLYVFSSYVASYIYIANKIFFFVTTKYVVIEYDDHVPSSDSAVFSMASVVGSFWFDFKRYSNSMSMRL